jgi:preprotein translocase subunit YajC
MKTETARKLKPGDRVVFSDGVKGTVTERGYGCVKISWEDGQVGLVDFNDFKNIEPTSNTSGST